MKTVTLVLTDAHSWGRSDDEPWVALGHALLHGNRATKALMFEVENVEDIKDVYVDGMGSVFTPDGSTFKKNEIEISKKMREAFNTFYWQLEDQRYD